MIAVRCHMIVYGFHMISLLVHSFFEGFQYDLVTFSYDLLRFPCDFTGFLNYCLALPFDVLALAPPWRAQCEIKAYTRKLDLHPWSPGIPVPGYNQSAASLCTCQTIRGPSWLTKSLGQLISKMQDKITKTLYRKYTHVLHLLQTEKWTMKAFLC